MTRPKRRRIKLDHPLWFRTVGWAGSRLVRNWVGTLDFHFRYRDPLVNPEVARRLGQPYIYAFFHEVMLFPAYYWAWPSMTILISDHRDGEMITRVVRGLGFNVVRGSTTRGGARALMELKELSRRGGNLCFTPDGPRGPRRSVQMGMIYLASKTGLPIVGAGLAFKNPWRARSWDRFAVPRPFSAAAGIGLEPLHVPADADRDTLEDCRRHIERGMNEATEEAETWVEVL